MKMAKTDELTPFLNRAYLTGIVASIAFVTGLQTAWFDFTFDDHSRLGILSKVNSFSDAFVTPSWPGNLYRPIETVSYLLTTRLLGDSPMSFHCTSILLYVIACVLVLHTLLKVVPTGIAAAAATLFCVHPLHSEVVANISYQSEILAAIFILAACSISVSLAGTAIQDRIGLRASLFVCGLLAMLSKESGLHVLFLSPLCILAKDRKDLKSALVCSAVLAVAAGISLVSRYQVLGEQFLVGSSVVVHDNPLVKLEYAMRLWNSLSFLGRYLLLSFVPFHVSAVSGFPKYVPVQNIFNSSPQDVLQILLFCMAVITAAVGTARGRRIGFWLAWFILAMTLSSNSIVLIGTIFADRLTFVSTVGSCGVLTEVLLLLVARISNYCLVLLIAGYFAIANQAIAKWRDNATLFAHEAIQSPRSAIAHYRNGVELLKEGNLNAARGELQTSLKLYPKNVGPIRFLAIVEHMAGNAKLANEYDRKYTSLSLDRSILRRLEECTVLKAQDCEALARIFRLHELRE